MIHDLPHELKPIEVARLKESVANSASGVRELGLSSCDWVVSCACDHKSWGNSDTIVAVVSGLDIRLNRTAQVKDLLCQAIVETIRSATTAYPHIKHIKAFTQSYDSNNEGLWPPLERLIT